MSIYFNAISTIYFVFYNIWFLPESILLRLSGGLLGGNPGFPEGPGLPDWYTAWWPLI